MNIQPLEQEIVTECKKCADFKDHDWGLCECICHEEPKAIFDWKGTAGQWNRIMTLRQYVDSQKLPTFDSALCAFSKYIDTRIQLNGIIVERLKNLGRIQSDIEYHGYQMQQMKNRNHA